MVLGNILEILYLPGGEEFLGEIGLFSYFLFTNHGK